MKKPLVTIVGRSYNQEPYIRDAIDSIFLQSYPNIEVILVDDGSTDGSRNEIEQAISGRRVKKLFLSTVNKGICASFNQCLPFIEGEYVIDLSLDDVMMPDRVSRQIALFSNYPDAGVVYHDVIYMDSSGKSQGLHFHDNPRFLVKDKVPEGMIFDHILGKYFLPPQSVMFRTEILKQKGGFDERLIYEDWDFLIYAARNHPFYYDPEPLTKVRLHNESASRVQSKQKTAAYLESTLMICHKALRMTQNQTERRALRRRTGHYWRRSLRILHIGLTIGFMRLYVLTWTSPLP